MGQGERVFLKFSQNLENFAALMSRIERKSVFI